MTEFLHHLATFGADHVCSSVFPFLDRILHVARLSILLAEQEKNFSYLAQILGPTLAWERSADAPDWLDESLAWVLTEVALLRMYNMCMQQPASQAIVRRSARSIPMFRADFLPFTSKIVEHSRYLPSTTSMDQQHAYG